MDMLSIREPVRGDRRRIEEILEGSGEFKEEEVACALELVDDVLDRGNREDDYVIFCADLPGRGVVGFVCYGRTPLAEGVYDLYWIVADFDYRRKGVGKFLLRNMEDRLKRKAARMVVAETSSTPAYAKARSFYRAEGYLEESRIRDFYSPGDDRLIYCKRF